MYKKENIYLTESQINDLVSEVANKVVNEVNEGYYSYMQPDTASDDFYESGCESTLKSKYPSMEFEFDVEDDGTVTALDMNTGKYYVGHGEVEHKTSGLGYPSSNDYDSEAEGEVGYYDYYNCLKTIMQKIDNDEPDGVDDSFIDTSEEEITEAIKKVVKNFLN